MKIVSEKVSEYRGVKSQNCMHVARFYADDAKEGDTPLHEHLFIIKEDKDLESAVDDYLNPKPIPEPSAELQAYRDSKNPASKISDIESRLAALEGEKAKEV